MYQSHDNFGGGSSSPEFETSIAVVGMSCRFAGARSIDDYWRNLRGGIESITPFSDEALLAAGVSPRLLNNPRYVKAGAELPDMEMFDAGFFGFTPREAAIMDPQHRHFLEAAWEALENAGHMPDRFPGAIGVFGGSGHNAYMPYNLLSNPKLVEDVGLFLLRHTGNDKDFLTTRASYLLDLKGPSVNVQTACSTSLVAIHMAVQSLLNGECDMALAGGVTIEMPHGRGYLYEEGEILSPDGHCRAFDAASQGTVFGSGVGIAVLRRLSDAIADGDHIYAVIRGSAVNNDGSGKMGYLAPSVDGQAQVIAEALTISDVPADSITYVEAHGTGTPVGDPIEVAALTQAYRRTTERTGYCGIGSVKGNIGHTDTAAGVASFIKVAMAMHHGELPPSLHFTQPNPSCEFETSPFKVNDKLQAWKPPLGMPRRAGISSLGVGGTNAHLVLEQAPARRKSGPSRPRQLLVVSGRTSEALDANLAALGQHLSAEPWVNLADAAYTLQVGRRPMKHRAVLVAEDTAEAGALLANRDRTRIQFHEAGDGDKGVAFMFAGGGAQHIGMGAGLYETEAVYREAVDECLDLLGRHCGLNIRDLLLPAEGVEPRRDAIERPSNALPALFTVQYALSKLWMSWGVKPKAMIGHSMGEYVAAHLAGVFSLADALRLVALRGKLFETLPEGGMLSVPMSEEALHPLLPAGLSIGVVNGPELSVASGPVAAIEELRAKLAEQEIESSLIRISVAAHSAMLEPILGEFTAFLRTVPMSAPTLPFVSNLSGRWITAEEATDPAYWTRHLRETVRFADGLAEILKDESRVLLEVGPGRVLSGLARAHPARSPKQHVFNSLRHPDEKVNDLAYVLTVLGRLWAVGAPVNWGFFRKGEERLRIPLPTYRFEKKRCWIEPGEGALLAASEPSLERRGDMREWLYEPVWSRTPRIAAAPVPATALVFVDRQGLGQRLIARLHAEGIAVVTVHAGSRFSRHSKDAFTIDPASPAHHEALIARLAQEGRAPGQIFHLWTVTGAPKRQDALKAADSIQKLGFYSLLHLARAIGQEDLAGDIRLLVVSDHMQRVSTESGIIPAKATVLGPCRVIPREYPNIRARSIDVLLPPAGSRQERELIDALVAEAGADDDAELIAYRASERWVQGFASTQVEAPAAHRGLRTGATYMLTGGLGGIGLALAKHLAEAFKARLVLLGRRGLPPRAEWQGRLEREPADPVSRRIAQVQELEALGAEVLVIEADVTDRKRMRAAVKEAAARFGAIDGVFHTAGVLDDGVIQLKTEQSAAAVLAPKVQGTLILDEALEGQKPDFLMLFSSVSASAGLPGQIDYAAANAFLDAYAQAHSGEGDTRVIAVGWSQWQEVGMAAALARQLGVVSDGDTDACADHPLAGHCIRNAEDERSYAARLTPKDCWLLDEHRLAEGGALIPGTGYLEIVRAAFAGGKADVPVELSDFTFFQPFAVADGAARDLQVHFDRQPDSKWRLSIVGRDANAEEGADWIEHVQGTIALSQAVPPAPVVIADIAGRCTRTVEDAPAGCSAGHMRFGPRWHTVSRIDFGAGEALMRLALPQEFASDLDAIGLHPALVDLATAGAQALVPGIDIAKDFFVPASYGSVRIHAPLPARVVSHIRYRGGEEAGVPALAAYDVTILDEAGNVLVEIDEFTMIRVREGARLGAQERVVPDRRARAQATANTLFAQSQNEGLMPAEGMSVIEQLLAGSASPQVLVSPQDFHAVLAQLRSAHARKDAAGEEGADEASGLDLSQFESGAERLVATMWCEMLGLDSVGRFDNFFDLGGHSLLAVQFINRMRKRAGKALPLTALIEAPTLAELAALIEPPGSTPAGVEADPGEVAPAGARAAIRITAGGTGRPVFLVHDGLGETLLYRTLALALDPAHPVYGLQPEVRADGSIVHTGITAMAAAHIESMRTVQAEGPYLLGGLCAGGVIAFEMARQLEDAGQTVSFVGIIDAADVGAAKRPFLVMRNRMKRLSSALTDPAASSPAERIGDAFRKIGNAAVYEVTSRLERRRIERELDLQRARADAPAEAEGPAEAAPLSYLEVYQAAHRAHRPEGRFGSGDVVLFKATRGDGSDDDAPFREQFGDHAMGWGRRVAGEVRVIDIPGGHSSALQEPNVAVLARHMQQCIDSALARLPASGIAGEGEGAFVSDRDPAAPSREDARATV